GVVKLPPRTALRHVRVAQHATPEEEARYSSSLLDAALGFIEAKTGAAIKGPLPIRFERLRIPVQGGGTLALAEASVPQVRAATRALTRPEATRRAPAERAMAEAVHQVASLAGVTVRERAGFVHFGHVPLAALEHFVRVLRGVKLPPPR